MRLGFDKASRAERFRLVELEEALGCYAGPIYFSPHYTASELLLESHGPLGTLWVGLALGAFYLALVWLNTLLGFVLTPLILMPATWLMDRMGRRRTEEERR